MSEAQKQSIKFISNPSGPIRGVLKVPGDKSISHRAVMLGAIAEGKTVVTDILEGEDVLSTIRIFSMMGVEIQRSSAQTAVIQGVGKYGLKQPSGLLDCGNSGTTMRLLMGILSAQPFKTTLIGDSSLMKRPMRRISEPLSLMGANIKTDENGRPPVTITPVNGLEGIDIELNVPSAQLKSALILAGLYAKGQTHITQPQITRDHSERMLEAFSCNLEYSGQTIIVTGKKNLKGTTINVPGDISSAAFLIVAATISPDSEILIENVGINDTRTGVIDILNLMNANILIENKRFFGGEPVANIRVRSAQLKGITIPTRLIPLAIDEFPAIFIAAACAQGETILRGAHELRVKESDRIAVMADGLRILGIEVETYEDGMRIIGQTKWAGGTIYAKHDHRIAMSFAIAALRATDQIIIKGAESVATSFPGFIQLMREAGLDIEEQVNL